MIVLVLVMTEIFVVACITLSLKEQYPIIGEYYSLSISLYDDYQINAHAYCIAPDNN